MISEANIYASDNLAFEAAMRAFHKGPPGTLRTIQLHDSTPPDYVKLTTTVRDERHAIADAINAYLDVRRLQTFVLQDKPAV